MQESERRVFAVDGVEYTITGHAQQRFRERWREVNPLRVEPHDHLPEIVRRLRFAVKESGELLAQRNLSHKDDAWYLLSQPYRFVMCGRRIMTIELAGEYRRLNKPAEERRATVPTGLVGKVRRDYKGRRR